MQVHEIGANTYHTYPIIGGPLDGHCVTTKGEARPNTLKVVLHAHISFRDNDRGGLPPEWRDLDGEVYAMTVFYGWSMSTCAYIPKGRIESWGPAKC